MKIHWSFYSPKEIRDILIALLETVVEVLIVAFVMSLPDLELPSRIDLTFGLVVYLICIKNIGGKR